MSHLNRLNIVRGLGAWLCVTGCVLLSGAPAQATMVHKFLTSFGSEGSGPGQLKKPSGVAVNGSTGLVPAAGDVYVVDTGNNRVERFSASGVYLGQFDGSGTWEVEGKVETGPAAPSGKFSELGPVAVDNSGSPVDPSSEDVYVVDRGHGVIDKFTATGEYVGQITGAGSPGGVFADGEGYERTMTGLAVDPAGVAWVGLKSAPIVGFSDAVANQFVPPEVQSLIGGVGVGLGVDGEDNFYFGGGTGASTKLSKSGAILAKPFGGDTKMFTLAVDPVGGEVYLDNGLERLAGETPSIEAFDLDGNLIESDQAGAAFPSFGAGHLKHSLGVGVNPANGAVYASDATLNDVSVFEGILLPTVAVGPLSGQSPRGVTLNGTVDPEGRLVTSCAFEYDTRAYAPGEATHGSSVLCSPASPGSGSSPVPVSAHLTNLTPQTTYYYRLVAGNSGGTGTSSGQEFFTGPRLSETSVVDVAGSSATLRAEVDANGGDTQYYFQYGPTLAYGSYAPLEPPGVDIGSSVGVQQLSVHVHGLQAGTVYHYRLVALQGGEEFEEPGPDHVFSTPSVAEGSGLPDGRMWELVSPADKKGALIELFGQGGQVQAAADGSGIAYVTAGTSLGEKPTGKSSYSPVLSQRSVSGWRSNDLALPGRLPEDEEAATEISQYTFEYRLFSPDLSMAAVEPQPAGTPPLAPGVSERTLYLRDNNDSTYTPLAWPGDVPAGTIIEERNFNKEVAEWEMMFLAATPDLGHVVFKTPMALTPEAIDEEHVNHEIPSYEQWNLYEWGGGALKLINVLPSGSVAHGPYPLFHAVKLAGQSDAGGRARGGAQRVVSDDGRRLAWTWGEPYTAAELERYRGLFVRDMVGEQTVRVGGSHALYQTMNSDGSKVFYIENGELYVYEWPVEAESGTAVDLTSSHGPEADGGVLEAVSDVSADGSHVYFVSTSVLAQGATSSEDNLYLLHDTGNGWVTSFVATLSEKDKPSWHAKNFEAPFLARTSSRVSPDGRFFVFMSERSLTGYDNVDAVSGERDEEVFVYDASSGGLTCVSCDPTGARPTGVFDSGTSELLVDRLSVWTAKESGGSDLHWDHWLAGSVPGWDDLSRDPATYQPRYLLSDGRVFFDSPVGLVPWDSNGLEDVYEYEPVGVGGCGTSGGVGLAVVSGGGGCLGLVSSGTSGQESAFYDASETGNDVFFDTTGKLVGADYDKGYDLYDAHVCTSVVPCVGETSVPPPCASGDGCKGAPVAQPEIFGPAASATFNGTGNVVEQLAGKGRPRSLTNRQKLTRALRACRKDKGKRRAVCERRARKRYPLKRAGKAVKTRNGRAR